MTNATHSRLITSYDPSPPKKNELSAGAALAAALVGIPVTFVLGVWNAFVLYKFYGWFAVPLGAPVLSLGSVWGLWMIIGILFVQLVPERDNRVITRSLARSLALALALLFGWIVSGWI